MLGLSLLVWLGALGCAAPRKRATYVIAVPGQGVMICRQERRIGSHLEHTVCRPPKQREQQRQDTLNDAARRRGSL